MLAGFRSGSVDLTVDGLGFFAAKGIKSPSSRRFRTKLFATIEESALAERREMIAGQLNDCFETLRENHYSGDGLLSKMQEVSDLEKKQLAYDLILDGRSLLDSALVDGIGDIDPGIQTKLETFLERRLQVLFHLLVSERRGNGEAIIIETARCQAILESLTRGRLVTLDPYPENAIPKQLDLEDKEMQRYLAALSEMLRKQCYQLLDAEVGSTGTATDYRYLQIENVHGRLAELVGPVRDGKGVRISSALMLPSRSRVVQVTVPAIDDKQLNNALLSVEKDLASLTEGFKEKYRYALIDRNCVNELLRSLNSSFPDQAGAKTALGDWIDPVADRVVIPHNFYYQVSTRYHVERITRYPSRRIAQIEAMKKQGDPLDIWFREGNSVSSTVYRSRTEDTPFLFFTDDVTWARPVLGLANLAWSAVHGVAGIVTLPVQGSEPLHQALRGMFYSMPELFLFNIRKGTYLHDAITPGGHEL